MEVTGRLHATFDIQETSPKFKKRDFVLMVADNPQYPQYVQFQFTQEKCSLLDNYQVGSEVTIMFNLRGRAWVNPQGETKYFNTLEAWTIRPASGQTTPQHQPPIAAPVNTGQPIDITKMNDSDDLPF